MSRRTFLVFAVVHAIAGLFLLFHDVGRSLWLDEFGTLWAVEGSAAQVIERSLSFHGQSPLSYGLHWLALQLLGESEWALRLPSALCFLASLPVVYLAGRELGSGSTVAAGGGSWEHAGAFALLLFGISPWVMAAGRIARPYSLALFAGAVMLWGFLRATQGRRRGRLMFVVGGVTLVYAHYALGVMAIGLGVAWLTVAELRQRYPLSRFGLDVACQVLLILPCLPQLRALADRSDDISWLGEPRLLWVVLPIAPFLPAVLVGLLPACRRALAQSNPLARGLAIACLTHLGVMVGLAYAGTNLVTPRYLATALLPVSLLAGRGLSGLNGVAVSSLVGRLLAPGLLALHFVLSVWTPQYLWGFGFQDWRGGIEALNKHVAEAPGPVCFRSGFIEDDQRVWGRPVSSVLASPLRSPGRVAPSWQMIPLVFRWEAEGREDYFERAVVPTLQQAEIFYHLGPADGFPRQFEDWVVNRFAGRFEAEALDLGPGIWGIRFRHR
ncbi:MAG: glycosyltransferase family 39 protein [Planctomycetota bacterium]|jgi:hypothetical protein